eukprot:CAMPEP_0202811076 /NCGR_PEP_ID=MMETSP1389-20130828/3029_1 /ASSEMBLY_ACC=CAM_ASM_000865 /TAXON_ID=302021 /ORGANISM="Rhodomonas sp., Strain CCMP768" /LENGTH=44 /DNA_ID= /DNA_START= /DNA_END= /DNA_ORIENTATION=
MSPSISSRSIGSRFMAPKAAATSARRRKERSIMLGMLNPKVGIG